MQSLIGSLLMNKLSSKLALFVVADSIFLRHPLHYPQLTDTNCVLKAASPKLMTFLLVSKAR